MEADRVLPASFPFDPGGVAVCLPEAGTAPLFPFDPGGTRAGSTASFPSGLSVRTSHPEAPRSTGFEEGNVSVDQVKSESPYGRRLLRCGASNIPGTAWQNFYGWVILGVCLTRWLMEAVLLLLSTFVGCFVLVLDSFVRCLIPMVLAIVPSSEEAAMSSGETASSVTSDEVPSSQVAEVDFRDRRRYLYSGLADHSPSRLRLFLRAVYEAWYNPESPSAGWCGRKQNEECSRVFDASKIQPFHVSRIKPYYSRSQYIVQPF